MLLLSVCTNLLVDQTCRTLRMLHIHAFAWFVHAQLCMWVVYVSHRWDITCRNKQKPCIIFKFSIHTGWPLRFKYFQIYCLRFYYFILENEFRTNFNRMLGKIRSNRQYNNIFHHILVDSGQRKRDPGVRAEYDFSGHLVALSAYK